MSENDTSDENEGRQRIVSVRLFVAPSQLQAGPLSLGGDEHHYLTKVRRLRVDDEVTLFDGQGRRAQAKILGVSSDKSELQVEEPESVPKPSFSLSIAPSLIKGDRMDLAITKMVELGVSTISPMTSERSIVRLTPERAKARDKRFESLALAAARQSRNPHPATIEPITSFARVVDGSSAESLKLIPCLHASARPLQEALPEPEIGSAIVLIGPEGGFGDEEIDKAVGSGFLPVNLGPRTLRAETACIALATILAFRYGDVGRR